MISSTWYVGVDQRTRPRAICPEYSVGSGVVLWILTRKLQQRTSWKRTAAYKPPTSVRGQSSRKSDLLFQTPNPTSSLESTTLSLVGSIKFAVWKTRRIWRLSIHITTTSTAKFSCFYKAKTVQVNTRKSTWDVAGLRVPIDFETPVHSGIDCTRGNGDGMRCTRSRFQSPLINSEAECQMRCRDIIDNKPLTSSY